MTPSQHHRIGWPLVLASLFQFAPATATTIYVVPDGFGNGNGCNLRDAIQAANTDTPTLYCAAGSGLDTIVLVPEPGVSTYTAYSNAGNDEDNNVSGDLDVKSQIIIQGASPTQSVIVGPLLDRAFDVISGNLTLNDVTVIGGSNVGANSRDGGVVNKRNGTSLAINRSVLRGGNAYYGGAIFAGGSGLLTLSKTTIHNNQAVYGGGVAISSQPAGDEAIFYNVTVSGNTADRGGGIYANSGFSLHNSTVARNRATLGGGIQYSGPVNTTTVYFANSLLVGNIDPAGQASDLFCFNNIQLGIRAYTMMGPAPTCSFALTVGTSSSDARLSPLFDFGSGLPTHALLPGSAALDAGNPNVSSPQTICLDTDARGVHRGTPCDIGAYEEHFDVTVNSFSDLPDLVPGDGVCQATGNVCTLRALATEASASGGRWFAHLLPGTYILSRALNTFSDPDGGDLDIKRSAGSSSPLQITLMGAGDADETRIVGGGTDRVLEISARSVSGLPLHYNHYPLAFALFNATLSNGGLNGDPFEQDTSSPLAGGGVKITGGKTLFYNVVVKDNFVESLPASEDSDGGGVYVDVRPTYPGVVPTAAPYATSSQFERFAIVGNATAVTMGGSSKHAGGLYAYGPYSNDMSDGIILGNGTIADNIGRDGGGATMRGHVDASFLSIVNNVSVADVFTAGGLTLSGQENRFRNVLISGNTANGAASDCLTYDAGLGASLVSLGYNLIATTLAACAISGDTSSNMLGTSAQLGPPAVFRGMPYYAPAGSSPPVDAIPIGACSDADGMSVNEDALGSWRRKPSNPACDVGAVEVGELPIFVDGFDP